MRVAEIGLFIAGVMTMILGVAACSVAVDARTAQCQSNRDCARYPGASCNLTFGICVPAVDAMGAAAQPGGGAGGRGVSGIVGGSGAGGVADACQGPSSCMACESGTLADLANRCTNVTCVPFDNRTRLTNLDGNGGLKPLP